MITSIEFTNVKALRKSSLPLTPFTLVLGPNGAGKTTVLQVLRGIASLAAPQETAKQDAGARMTWSSLFSISAKDRSATVEVTLHLHLKELQDRAIIVAYQWHPTPRQGKSGPEMRYEDGNVLQPPEVAVVLRWLGRMETYALDYAAIARAVPVSSKVSLDQHGAGLAAVLDDLKDNQPERWELLLAEMREWLPEYDQILFDKPQQGTKGIVLRTRKGGHRILAHELSQGTLIALALLTLAYLPDPPSLVGLEEIDRGLHPRLLRHVQDALYRLSYPESCGETRPPIQVIATTHSPYLLDLYREHPEEVVLAQKEGLEVEMRRLSDIDNCREILGDSPLSEVWYSGVLGGVSVKP